MTPVMIQDTVSVALSSTIENLIAINTAAARYVRAPYDAIGKLFLNVTTNTGRVELIVDGKTIMDSSDSKVETVAGKFQDPDDTVVEQFFIRKGAQLVIRAVNSSAGAACIVQYRFVLTEATAQPAACRYTQRFVSVPASSIVQILSGLRFERPITNSLLTFFASASALGLNGEVFVDGVSVAPALPIGATNRMPLNPYDKFIEDIEVETDKLIEIRITNTSGGALNFFWKTHLQELDVV